MNAIEFVKEVKDSNICPKDFDKIYEEFKFYQKAALDTLDEFHRVCEKNNIPYFVQYGSLLGLIRDGGQIPWDYDVDVVVPYSEKANLNQHSKNQGHGIRSNHVMANRGGNNGNSDRLYFCGLQNHSRC